MQRISLRLSHILVQAALFMGPSLAQTGDVLSVHDRQAGVAHLETSRAAIIEAVRGLSANQWNFRESPGRWSVAEVVEHLALTEEILFKNVEQIMKTPETSTKRDHASLDKTILVAVPDRSNKATAAPGTEPTGRWLPNSALNEFRARRQKTIEFLRTTAGLRVHRSESPFGEPMDAYQWLLFISAHSERHLKQIVEVKAASEFPRK